MHGSVSAVTGLQKADLLIALGARFDDRVTGQLKTFAPDAKVIHADIDPAEISKNRKADVPIVGDCKAVIADLIEAARRRHRRRPRRGLHRVARARRGVEGGLPARLHRARGRHPRTAVRPRAAQRDRRAGGLLRRRRRPAPDVGGAVRPVRAPQRLAELRRPRDDGVRRAGRHGCPGRPARPHGVGDRRRRLLPDDQPGARDLRHQQHPDQGRDHQQQLARHGPPVADALLQRALLQHRPAHLGRLPRPRLRQARRGLRLRRVPVRAARGRRRDDPRGDGDQRPARRRRLRRAPRRHGLADGPRRREQRPHPGRPRHRARSGTARSPRRSSRASTPTTTGCPRAPTRTEGGTAMSKHTLSVLVENKPGVLARIAALFSRRGLQHRLPRRGGDRVPRRLPDDRRRRRRGPPAGAGDQAAQQARRGAQGRRARAEPRPCSARSCSSRCAPTPAPAARCSRWCRCSAPRSSTSPPTR